MRKYFVLAAALMLSLSAHAFDGKQCLFAECMVGDVVVTTPTDASGPHCKRLGLTIYAWYLNHPSQLAPGIEGEKVLQRLQKEAGARRLTEVAQNCERTIIGQRGRIVDLATPKAGLVLVQPLDGSPAYWISNLDVSKP